MQKKKNVTGNKLKIRKLAEKELKSRKPKVEKVLNPEMKKLFYELQVHQIELEMQNEELRRAQLFLNESREKYYDLFSNAPVGYISLNEKGIIIEANQTAANLFDLESSKLKNKSFTNFIVKESNTRCVRKV